MLTDNPRELAAIINRMRPGHQLKLAQHERLRLRGDLHRTGWEIVLDNVVGSAHEDIWRFLPDIGGGMTIVRLEEPAPPPQETV